MSQQAIKSEPSGITDGVAEEDRSQRPAPHPLSALIGGSAKNAWSGWGGILSHFHQAGFPMAKSPGEIAQAGKDAIDAVTKSSAALVESYGEIGRHFLALAHQSATARLAADREIFDLKTPGDWLDLQSKWAGDFMVTALTHMAHLSRLSAKAVDETYEPLKAHFAAPFGKTPGFP